MDAYNKLGSIAKDHPDIELFTQFQNLVEDLWMYSETQQAYDVFIWDNKTHGALLNEYSDFHFMSVVEKIHGERIPIRKSSLLQDKHRHFFVFEGDKLANKKPSKFYKNRYDVWNRFVGRIYTDNGPLNKQEIQRMRVLARHVWELEANSIRVFEFDSPTIQQYLMGKTENGNWLGIHTISVET